MNEMSQKADAELNPAGKRYAYTLKNFLLALREREKKERKEQEERLREEFEKEHLKNVLINSMKRRKYAEQARRQGKRVVIYCEECFIRKAKQKNDKDFWVCDECLAGEK